MESVNYTFASSLFVYLDSVIYVYVYCYKNCEGKQKILKLGFKVFPALNPLDLLVAFPADCDACLDCLGTVSLWNSEGEDICAAKQRIFP